MKPPFNLFVVSAAVFRKIIVKTGSGLFGGNLTINSKKKIEKEREIERETS
jgi:hypothetical protein